MDGVDANGTAGSPERDWVDANQCAGTSEAHWVDTKQPAGSPEAHWVDAKQSACSPEAHWVDAPEADAVLAHQRALTTLAFGAALPGSSGLGKAGRQTAPCAGRVGMKAAYWVGRKFLVVAGAPVTAWVCADVVEMPVDLVGAEHQALVLWTQSHSVLGFQIQGDTG